MSEEYYSVPFPGMETQGMPVDTAKDRKPVVKLPLPPSRPLPPGDDDSMDLDQREDKDQEMDIGNSKPDDDVMDIAESNTVEEVRIKQEMK